MLRRPWARGGTARCTRCAHTGRPPRRGIGMLLSFIVMALYFHRLTVYSLPNAEVIVSAFLPLGPLGQGAFGIMQLAAVARAVLPASGFAADAAGVAVPQAGEVRPVAARLPGCRQNEVLGAWKEERRGRRRSCDLRRLPSSACKQTACGGCARRALISAHACRCALVRCRLGGAAKIRLLHYARSAKSGTRARRWSSWCRRWWG
jgi:hypothetical protein